MKVTNAAATHRLNHKPYTQEEMGVAEKNTKTIPAMYVILNARAEIRPFNQRRKAKATATIPMPIKNEFPFAICRATGFIACLARSV